MQQEEKPTSEEIKAQEIDFQKRVKAHNEVAIPSLAKNKLGLGAVPFITPDGRVLARAIYFDDNKPKEKVAEKPISSSYNKESESDDTIPQV